MAVLPEVVLHRVFIAGFRSIRKDTRLLETIFRNLDQQSLAQVKNFILTNSIDFGINYPREKPKLPGIYMLLRGENEAQAFLGNMGGAAPNYDVPDEEFTYFLGGNGDPETLGGEQSLILGNLKVNYSANSKVYFQASSEEALNELIASDKVPQPVAVVVSGTGKGQSFPVLSISTNSIDIDGTYDPQLDTTSVINLRRLNPDPQTVGEPSKLYRGGSTNIYRTSVNYSTQYQLMILAGSQEQVLYLYSIVKAILLSQTAFLEQEGILGLQISGSDFAPRSEYLPNDIFQRVMNLQFTYPFDFLEESGTAFSRIDVAIQCDLEENACCDIDFSVQL